QADDDVHQRRLAAAGRAYDGQEFAVADVEVGLQQRLHAAPLGPEDVADAADRDDGVARSARPARGLLLNRCRRTAEHTCPAISSHCNPAFDFRESANTVSMTMPIKPILPVAIPQTNARLARGMRAGRWLFATGQSGTDYVNGLAPEVVQAEHPLNG